MNDIEVFYYGGREIDESVKDECSNCGYGEGQIDLIVTDMQYPLEAGKEVVRR